MLPLKFFALTLVMAPLGIPCWAQPAPPEVPPGQAKKDDPQSLEGDGLATGRKNVQWTIDAETPTSITATFVSGRPLGDVILWLTPSLAEFVTVSPDSFDAVGADQSKQITLTFDDSSLGNKNVVAGTVHVKQLIDDRPRRTFGRPLQAKFGGGEETEEVDAAAVVGAADFLGGPVAPGEIVTIFGKGLGPTNETALLAIDSNGRVADYLANTQVLFDGIPAPVIFVTDQQVSVVVPFDVAGRPTVEMLLTHLDQISPPVELPVQAISPALFTIDASGEGPGAILNQDFTLNTPANPASQGSVVMLYGTGSGLWQGGNVDGELVTELLQPEKSVRVEIGGVGVPVPYAGGAPGLINAVIQINAEITLDVPRGDAVPVIFTVGEESSKAAVTVSIE